VALVQAAATLPIFLLAIPAGVLSDILDRRKFLIAIQVLLGLRQPLADGAVAEPRLQLSVQRAGRR
jgi:MFS family permease